MTRVTGTRNENELLSFALKTTTARDDSTPSAEFIDDLGPAGRESWSARRADAMVAMASSYLSGNAGRTRNSSDDYLVTIHVDQSALATGTGRSSLPIESVKRLCCDGHAVILGEDEHGEPLNIGRKTRTVPTAIKRAGQTTFFEVLNVRLAADRRRSRVRLGDDCK